MQYHYKIILIFFLLLYFTAAALSQGREKVDSPYKEENGPLILPFYFLEYPFNLRGGFTSPGMDQSLYLTKNAAQLSHSAILSMRKSNYSRLEGCAAIFAVGLFDFLFFYLPPGYAWLHEEWHRAVMSNRDIKSYNDVYNFELFADSIAVSHVKDQDLIMLKREHPRDMIRLSAAGYEADIELTRVMRKDSFFSGRPVYYDMISWWLNTINAVAYIDTCTKREADDFTEEMNREDGSSISARDFVGLDFPAWVYDLFRPEEPYEARGVHPSGIGIDRYIKYSDLTGEEKKYLKLQRNLSYINFISPQLIGFNNFTFNSPFNNGKVYWNFLFTHQLTSFGYTIDGSIFLSQGPVNLVVVYHNYANKERYLPGLEIEIFRFPLSVDDTKIFIDAALGIWLQPEEQKFKTGDSKPGGRSMLKLAFPLMEKLEWFIKSDVKTEGWVAGNVYLDKAAAVETGINWIF